METVQRSVEHKASGCVLRAGIAELKEAENLSFRLDYLVKLLAGGLDVNDDFDMYLLDSALRPSREYNRIMIAHGGDVLGLEFMRCAEGNLDKFAVVMPCASDPGKYGVYYFDTNGFSRHHVEDTAIQATQTMIREGFTTESPGALDRLSSTPEWERGMAWADLVMQYSRRQITLEELNTKQCELAKRYAHLSASSSCGEGVVHHG